MQAYAQDYQRQQERNDRLIAAAGTLAFVIAIMLILFLYIIYTPNPPFPETGGGGGGIELSFGNSVDGMGDMNPDQLSGTALPTAPVPEQNYMTEEGDETSPTVNKDPEKPKTNTTQEPVKPQQTSTVPLFNKRGGQEGNTGKAGNQGQPNGTPGFKGSGNGAGGNGTGGGKGNGNGTGDGDGEGPGSGSGKGGQIGPRISGISRGATYVPRPSSSQKEGFVVVNIKVDDSGKVVSATVGKGTTLTDSQAINNALAAARRTTFKVSPDSDDEFGTITYQFVR